MGRTARILGADFWRAGLVAARRHADPSGCRVGCLRFDGRRPCLGGGATHARRWQASVVAHPRRADGLGGGAGSVFLAWSDSACSHSPWMCLRIIGSWAIAIGLLQVVATMRLRKHIQGEWLHALSGLLSLVFGLAIVLWPGAGAIALAWLIGWFSILFGAILLTMAFSLRIVSRS